MSLHGLTLTGNRQLVIRSLDESPDGSMQRPFATLLPAFSAGEREQAEAMARRLIEIGGTEFCCVGPEAESLHDALDEIVESKGALAIVTTWHDDPDEACEYFLFGSPARGATLLALISSHPQLQATLEQHAREADE